MVAPPKPAFSRRRFLTLGAAALGLAACGPERDAVASVFTPSPTVPQPSAIPATAVPSPTTVPRATLAIAGDVMLDRSIGSRILAGEAATIFAGVEQPLKAADIAVVNLECALSDRGSPQSKGYTFRAPPAAIDALTTAGIDVVSLANNHALDYGPDALLDTVRRCRDAGIETAGAGPDIAAARVPVILERGGLRIAFLAYVDAPAEGSFSQGSWDAGPASPGVAWLDIDRMAADIAAAKAEADHVLALLHFGFEFHSEPASIQVAQARAAIDAGATVVAGHHPHVLQPVEEYAGGLIAYSLGNFAFDGFDPPANDSAILSLELDSGGIAGYELLPVSIVNGLPYLA